MLVKCKVLIIDGGESTRNFMRFVLTNSGYRTSIAKNGAKALELLGDEMFDVIVIDPRLLPDMDGIDLIKEARTIDAFKSVPILAVTQFFHPELQEQGEAAGITDWIVQPVSPQKLVEIVKDIAPAPEVYDDY